MVPIHDTDLAEERWSKAEWSNYELWEKIEVRLRRMRRLWIAATIVVFLMLSSVPIVMDRAPKWRALRFSRKLAQEINWLKREAGTEQRPYRIQFKKDGSLDYAIEKLQKCGDPSGVSVKNSSLNAGAGGFVLLSAVRGSELGIPGLVDSFCYDPLQGSDATTKGEGLVGFGILPVNDLTAQRTDRLSVLLLRGQSAEISFD